MPQPNWWRIRTVEIFCVLLWVSIAAFPAVVLGHSRAMAEQLCLPPAVFALCFLSVRLVDQTLALSDSLGQYSWLKLIPVLLFTFFVAIFASMFARAVCSDLAKRWSYTIVLSMLSTTYRGWWGLRSNLYRDVLLVCGWFAFAHLTNVLRSDKDMEFFVGSLDYSLENLKSSLEVLDLVPGQESSFFSLGSLGFSEIKIWSGLYTLVHILWTFSYLLDDFWA